MFPFEAAHPFMFVNQTMQMSMLRGSLPLPPPLHCEFLATYHPAQPVDMPAKLGTAGLGIGRDGDEQKLRERTPNQSVRKRSMFIAIDKSEIDTILNSIANS